MDRCRRTGRLAVRIVAGAGLLVGATAAAALPPTAGGRPPAPSGTAGAGPGATSPAAAAVPSCPITSWPLAKRVRQLLFVSGEFSDLAASEADAAAGVGGFVLFGAPPAGSGPSIRSGIAALDEAAVAAGQAKPWVSTDEEGGQVQRLANVVGSLPAPRTMAETDTPAQVKSLVEAKATAMAGLGVGVDLAPVVDTAPADDTVADEDTRSFSADPSTVTAYSSAFVAGLESAGVVPVIKHFPGLGHADADTDDGPATDPPLASLEADDLIPFRSDVERGAPVVMVGHPIVPGLTSGQPASMAPATYAYLRQQLGFGGLAITDALGAGAISAAGYTEATASVRAVESGADMVLVDAADVGPATAALERAVDAGALPVADLDRAVALVVAAKGVPSCLPARDPGCGADGEGRRIVAVAADPAVAGGYWEVDAGGCVTSRGGAPTVGSLGSAALPAPVVGIVAAPGGRGYWLVDADGSVWNFGRAAWHGSARGYDLETPIAAMAATPSGGGYWLVAAGGRVFDFGDAAPYGSVAARLGSTVPSRVTAIGAGPGGRGYWIASADGTVYAFGDAATDGGTSGLALPVVGLVPSSGAAGYWLVAESGRVGAFGAAAYHGSGTTAPAPAPTVGLVPARTGYDLVLADGQVEAFP